MIPPPPSDTAAPPAVRLHPREAREAVVVRFAGDSGDGMQITGSEFTVETALAGNDLATFPDYPAEIRAPAGTTFGVSAFQIHFGSQEVLTAGDELDALVALNPAALKVNLKDLRVGAIFRNQKAERIDQAVGGGHRRVGVRERQGRDPMGDASFLVQYGLTRFRAGISSKSCPPLSCWRASAWREAVAAVPRRRFCRLPRCRRITCTACRNRNTCRSSSWAW